ncbi:helix-turn-helix transcriptional regulator [Streptomyces diastatochromogenes]|nr:helix-turn-helix transcriptional regulator [Streptomyces diastatochromogenes]
MTAAPHRDHGAEELCAAGVKLYEQALRDGRLRVEEAVEAPCLTRFGLLHRPATNPPGSNPSPRRRPDPDAARLPGPDRGRVPARGPAGGAVRAADADGRTAGRRRRHPLLRLHSGTQRINQALTEAMEQARQEVLCIQPSAGMAGPRGEAAHDVAYHRDQRLLDRGGRIRTLFQHTVVHLPAVHAYNERLVGDIEGRCLDELTDRLIVMDRTVAFLPADDDGALALEVRHPALVAYFVTTFDRLWRLATPVYPQPVRRPTLKGVTPRQRAIARLLVEGHTDAVIAERLGMNVRTTRDHIARLATTLGSDSRAQLGYLIARSGILELEEAAR